MKNLTIYLIFMIILSVVVYLLVVKPIDQKYVDAYKKCMQLVELELIEDESECQKYLSKNNQ